MDDRVAVRAHWTEIVNRIQAVLLPDFCDSYDVVHLYVSRSRLASKSNPQTIQLLP
jgi:hypothetical protein